MATMNAIGRKLQRGVDLIGAVLFLIIFACFLLQIVARYVFSWPIGWPDEVITILFVWVVMWGAAFMVPLDRQIRFDLLHEALPRRVGRWSEAASLAVTGLLFLAAMPVVLDYIRFTDAQFTPIMSVPLSWVYAPTALLFGATVVRIALAVWRLASGRSRESVSDE